MRVINFLIYILFLFSLVFNAYLWFYKVPNLKKIIYDLNKENESLLKEISKSNIRSDTSLTILLPSDEIFEPGSVEISDKGSAKLDSLISEILKGGFNELQVAVYTDKSPIKTNVDKYPTNWELAASRATSIVRYFVKKGVDPSKLSAVSYGDSRAKYGGSRDRIVEIRVF